MQKQNRFFTENRSFYAACFSVKNLFFAGTVYQKTFVASFQNTMEASANAFQIFVKMISP